MHKIEQMLCDELDAIADDGKLTRDSLNDIEKLTHSLKSLKAVMAMEEYSGDDYSRDYSNDYSGRMSSRRDSMGRYSRDNENSYRNSYRSERSYSRMSGDDMMGMLDQMLRDATDTKERQAIQKIMDHMER